VSLFFDSGSGSSPAHMLSSEEDIDLLLSLGPRGNAGAWENRSYQFLEENPPYNGYFSLRLEKNWTAREVDPPEDDEPAMQRILDRINGAKDACAPISINYAKRHFDMRHTGSTQKCAAPVGLRSSPKPVRSSTSVAVVRRPPVISLVAWRCTLPSAFATHTVLALCVY
jgi:hypothetical protein